MPTKQPSRWTQWRARRAKRKAAKMLNAATDDITTVYRTTDDKVLTTEEMGIIIGAKFSEIMAMGMSAREAHDILIQLILEAFGENSNANPRTTALLLVTIQQEAVRRMPQQPT